MSPYLIASVACVEEECGDLIYSIGFILELEGEKKGFVSIRFKLSAMTSVIFFHNEVTIEFCRPLTDAFSD